MYRVEFSSRAAREFRKLSPEVQHRLDPAIIALAQNPRLPGCVKLSGEQSLWRIRVAVKSMIHEPFHLRVHVPSLLLPPFRRQGEIAGLV